MAVTRRFFLKSSGVALASFAAAPSFLQRAALAQTLRAGKDRPIIIAIFQRGAADGVSMVVPFGDRSYSAPGRRSPYPSRRAGTRTRPSTWTASSRCTRARPVQADLRGGPSRDSARGRLARQHAVALRRAGLHGVGHAREQGHSRRMAEPLYAGEEGRESYAVPRRGFQREHAAHVAGPARPRIAMTNIADFGVRAGQGNSQVAQSFEALYAQGATGHALRHRQGSVRSREDAEEGEPAAVCAPLTARTIRARLTGRRCSRSRS